MNGLWLLAWGLAYLGHIWFWIEKKKQTPAAAPLLAAAAIVIVLYAGAICRVLLPAAVLIWLSGCFFCGWMIMRRSKALFSVDILLFVIGCTCLVLRYRNSFLVQYDDYSHWGMIVKHLLSTNRLPQHGDTLITFQSYPPGAALWIYGVSRLAGGDEGIMLAAQAVLTLAGWFPLLALAGGKGTAFKKAICLVTMMIGLSLFQGTASLMVDNLVSALAVGGLCVIVLQVRQDCEKPLQAGMILAVLSLVKDSGLFFVFVLVALGAVLCTRTKQTQKMKKLALTIAPAAVVRAVWYANIKLAFTSAGTTRHALTLDNMRAMGADKSYQDIWQIGVQIFKQAASIHNLAVQALCAVAIFTAVLFVARWIEKGVWQAGPELAALAGSTAIYAAWLMVMWVTYAFSMELEGARNLIAFERYNSTCALFLLGMFVIWVLTCANQKSCRDLIAIACLCLPLLAGGWYNGAERLFHETYHVPLRIQMEQAVVERPLQENENAAVVIDQDENGMFAGYMARYRLQSEKIQILHPENVNWNQADTVFYWLSAAEPENVSGAEVILSKERGVQ